MFGELFGRALDCVYPRLCVSCDASITAEPFCAGCMESLYPLQNGCRICADPAMSTGLCRRCLRSAPPYARLFAPYLYGGELAIALSRLKFGRRADIARSLAPFLRAPLAAAVADSGSELLVPLPLSRRRLSQRGFNQSERLVAHCRGPVPVAPRVLVRSRHNRRQSELPAGARRANVTGAFAVPRRFRQRIRGRRLLLCDDIVTTGETLRSAAAALVAAGAGEVSCFAVARAEAP